jgi:putative glutamine amidotransferase
VSGAATRPLIGVTTSEMREAHRSHPLPDGDPAQREMALGMVYLQAIERAGGLPVVLPPLRHDAIEELLDRLDGLCLSGGPDLDPDIYGQPPHHLLGEIEPDLDAFELALAQAADARGLPVLGVCRGAQAMNVARGGTLHQHVDDVVSGVIAHRQTEALGVATHPVAIEPRTRLAAVTGAHALDVNSFHHQAVDRLGRDLRAAARSADGLIEAIEDAGPGLYLGVQWHAEGLVARPEQLALFGELVDAAADRSIAAPRRT